jgi:hypothetical protein
MKQSLSPCELSGRPLPPTGSLPVQRSFVTFLLGRFLVAVIGGARSVTAPQARAPLHDFAVSLALFSPTQAE